MQKLQLVGVIALASLAIGCVPTDPYPYLGPPDIGVVQPTYSDDGRIRYEQDPSDPYCTQEVLIATGEVLGVSCVAVAS